MHLISRKALKQFWDRHPDSQNSLIRWFHIMEKNEFSTFNSLRQTFPSADLVGELVVFNLGGDKYRLIVSVRFNRAKVFIRHVLTHSEYDKEAWKK